MNTRTRISALAAVVAVTAGAMAPAAHSYAASSASASASPSVTGLAARAEPGPALVTNDQGVNLAMWQAYGKKTGDRLMWAVRRPGRAWTNPKVMLSADYSNRQRYSPARRASLALASGHRVAATFLDHQARVVVRMWSPANGWGRAVHLTDARHRAIWPAIASNSRGDMAVAWEMNKKSGDPARTMVAVRRQGAWKVTSAGQAATSFTHYLPQVRIGVAGDGDATVVWQQKFGDSATTVAKTLAAGTSTWSAPARLGSTRAFGERNPTALAVQPNGGAILNPAVDSGDLFSRVTGNTWQARAAADLPFFKNALSAPDGALVTWGSNAGVYVDADGVAGPGQPVNIGRPAFTGNNVGSDHLLVLPDETLVDVTASNHAVQYATRAPGQPWSSPTTVKTLTRFLDSTLYLTATTSTSTSTKGQVDVLVGTSATANLFTPHDLRAIRFAVVS
jgi:hypothetical protein